MVCKHHATAKKCSLLPLKTFHFFPGELVKQTCSLVRSKELKIPPRAIVCIQLSLLSSFTELSGPLSFAFPT